MRRWTFLTTAMPFAIATAAASSSLRGPEGITAIGSGAIATGGSGTTYCASAAPGKSASAAAIAETKNLGMKQTPDWLGGPGVLPSRSTGPVNHGSRAAASGRQIGDDGVEDQPAVECGSEPAVLQGLDQSVLPKEFQTGG